MRAALFITCLGDTLFPGVGRATVRILERLGGVSVATAQRTHALASGEKGGAPLVARETCFAVAAILSSDIADAVEIVPEYVQ